MHKTLKQYAKTFLIVVGALTLVNFANDIAGTIYIRNHTNAISHLEEAWKACDAVTEREPDLRNTVGADGYAREDCRNAAFARHERGKDNFMAICSISQVGNFLSYSESSGGGDVAHIPFYYDLPFGFMLYGSCMDFLDNPGSPAPA